MSDKPPKAEHPFLVAQDGSLVPVTDQTPLFWHLEWIKTHASILLHDFDEIERMYGRQQSRRGATLDVERPIVSWEASHLDDFHDIRRALIREVSTHLPKVRIPELKDMTKAWRWGRPMPEKRAFVDELQNVEHEANLRQKEIQSADADAKSDTEPEVRVSKTENGTMRRYPRLTSKYRTILNWIAKASKAVVAGRAIGELHFDGKTLGYSHMYRQKVDAADLQELENGGWLRIRMESGGSRYVSLTNRAFFAVMRQFDANSETQLSTSELTILGEACGVANSSTDAYFSPQSVANYSMFSRDDIVVSLDRIAAKGYAIKQGSELYALTPEGVGMIEENDLQSREVQKEGPKIMGDQFNIIGSSIGALQNRTSQSSQTVAQTINPDMKVWVT
jgi:hypothetical protein